MLAVLMALALVGGPTSAATARSGRHQHDAHVKKHVTRSTRSAPKKATVTRPAPRPTPRPGSTASPTPTPTTTAALTVLPAGWITTPDAIRRVAPLSATELTPSALGSAVHVPVDDATRYQSMDGFGAALTESSAHLLMRLTPAARTAALRSLFDPIAGAGLDLVRLPSEQATSPCLATPTTTSPPARRISTSAASAWPTTTTRSCRCCRRPRG